MKVLDHLKSSEPQVDPVEERDEVANHQKGHNAQGHLAHCPSLDSLVRGPFDEGHRWILNRAACGSNQEEMRFTLIRVEQTDASAAHLPASRSARPQRLC